MFWQIVTSRLSEVDFLNTLGVAADSRRKIRVLLNHCERGKRNLGWAIGKSNLGCVGHNGSDEEVR